MIKKNNLSLIEDKTTEWNKGINFLLTGVIIILPVVFCSCSIPKFAPIKDLSLQVLVLLGFILWMLRMIAAEKICWQSGSLDKPIALYLIWGCLSLIWSINAYNSIPSLPLFLAGPILFFVITNSVREQKIIDKLLLIIIIVGLGMSIYGILQYFGIDFRFWRRNMGRQRVMGLFGNVNYFAEYLILPLSLVIGLFIAKNKTYKRFLLFGVLFVMSLALFFTFTRGSYLAIAVAIPVMLLLYFKSAGDDKNKRFYKKIILSFLLLIVIALALIYIPHPLNRGNTALGKLRSRVAIETLLSGSSTLRRIATWKCTWMMIEDYPILGSGLGTYAYHTLKYQAEFFAKANNRDIYPHGFAAQAHNEYLQLWSELGAIGLLLFLWIIFTYYRNILKVIHEMRDREKAVTIGLAGGVTAVLVDAIFGFPLQLATSISLFWMFLGLSAGQINIALYDKIDKISKEKRTDYNKKPVVKKGKRKTGFFKTKDRKGIACSIVIVLMIICLFFLIRPFIARVYWYYGNEQFFSGNSKKAINTYEKALKWNPWQGEIYFELANNLRLMSNNKSALEYLHKAEIYTDNHYLPGNIAYLYNKEGESVKAIPYLEKAIKYQSKRRGMLPLQLQLANIYLTVDDYQNAERLFNDVITYSPKSVEAYYGLANVYIKQGRKEQAIEALEKIIEIAPESELADNARTMLTESKTD